MWPFDLVTQESDRTGSGEVGLWQGYMLARGIGSAPLGETGSFPQGVSDRAGCGARSPLHSQNHWDHEMLGMGASSQPPPLLGASP